MSGSALQLSPFAGQSISLRFPLLLLLLSPSPVFSADPGAPAPGRQPLSCPRRAPVLRPWPGTPRPPLPSRPPSFPFQLAVPGRGEGAVCRWDGGSLQTPGDVAWARSPRGSFCGGKGRLGSWAALGKGTASLQAPSPVLGPQRS